MKKEEEEEVGEGWEFLYLSSTRFLPPPAELTCPFISSPPSELEQVFSFLFSTEVVLIVNITLPL